MPAAFQHKAIPDSILHFTKRDKRRAGCLFYLAAVSSILALAALTWDASQHLGTRLQPVAGAAAHVPADFRFNKVVALIAFDRFEYFRQVVHSLRQAWGASNYILTIWIDGAPIANTTNGSRSFDSTGWQDVLSLSQQLQWLVRHGDGGFRDVLVDVSPIHVGVWANKKRGVAGAMELSDFVIILEDDIVVASDALRWFEWPVSSGLAFRRADLALATCWSTSFPHHEGAVEAHDHLAVRELGMLDKYWVDSWAQPWGWALWRSTWDALGEEWNGRDVHLGRLVAARGWREVMPLVARCNNIGSVGFHKKGATRGHIHRRAVTSDAFPGLDACSYTEVPRQNHSRPLYSEDLYQQLVRKGLIADARFLNMSLAQHQAAMAAWLRDGLRSPLGTSTC